MAKRRLARTILGFVGDRELDGKKITKVTQLGNTILYKIFLGANDETILGVFGRDELSKLRQAQVSDLYFYGDMSDEERIEISRKFYEQASEEVKKKSLLVAKGYVDNMQFELNQNMVQNIGQLAQPTPGNLFPEGQSEAGPIATIHIGVDNVKQMLDRVTGELNEIIFGIFSSLKSLTQQLQNYFAGGLEDDQQASDARQAAVNIEEKTAEVQAQRAKDADTAKAHRASAERRKVRKSQSTAAFEESKQPIVLDKLIEQMLNESFN